VVSALQIFQLKFYMQFPMRDACPALYILILSDGEYKIRNASWCSFLSPPTISSSIDHSAFLMALLSSSSLRISQIRGKIIFLRFNNLRFSIQHGHRKHSSMTTELYQKQINIKTRGKRKVVPVLNKLSTKPRRRMGEWMYTPTFS
jgi:hypothetical protein